MCMRSTNWRTQSENYFCRTEWLPFELWPGYLAYDIRTFRVNSAPNMELDFLTVERDSVSSKDHLPASIPRVHKTVMRDFVGLDHVDAGSFL